MSAATGHRASNGLYFRVAGEGRPLLLLHGLMASGRMFDPLVESLRADFRMLIPDLRGHGRSGRLGGPYDVAALAADLDLVLAEAGFSRGVVLGYSHGGAVAQQFARTQPSRVDKLILCCTYACNVSTLRERMEANVLLALLHLLSPGMLARLIVQPSQMQGKGAKAPSRAQALWLRAIMAENKARAMRGAVRGLIAFDSRPWLHDIPVPTLVIGGTHDIGVPQHHFDTLVAGIPGAAGRLVDRAGHTLIWTHTAELAEIVRAA